MKQITTILLTGTAAIFMTACGGGSSSDLTLPPAVIDPTPPPVVVDPMTERDLISIFYNAPAGMCEDVVFQDFVEDGMEEEGFVVDYYLFREDTNDVSCDTYDRVEEITETGGCATSDLALQDPSLPDTDTSCVVGIDLDPSAQPAVKDTDATLKTGVTKNTDIISTINSAVFAW